MVEVVRRSLELRAGRRKSTVYDLRSYAGSMVRHKDWAEKPLRGIGVEECREMLKDVFGHSGHVLRAAGGTAIAPRNWAKRWRTLRTRAGLLDWQQDALRHTFASYHLRRFCNPPQLQAEMGHRNSVLLRTRYLNLNRLTAKSAIGFWAA